MSRPAEGWPVQVLRPYPGCERVVFSRCAARSPEFGANPAAGGAAVIVGSAAGPDEASVVSRARGELVERASNVLAGRRAEREPGCVASFEELRRRGIPALDPAGFCGELTVRSVSAMWVRGESLVTGARVWVPAGAVYLRHRPPPGCVALVRTGSTGLGAHPERAVAARHAVLEVLERELLVAAWYDAAPPVIVGEPEPSATVAEVLTGLGLSLRVWALGGPGALVCVLACVHVGGGMAPSFGARCAEPEAGRGSERAVDTAVYEALMVRWSMTTPAAARARRAMAGRLPVGPLEHAVYAFDRSDAPAHLYARLVPGATEAARSDPARLLSEATGADVVAVETPAPEFCGPGVQVVRVVAPGARQLPGREPEGSAVPPHPIG